MSAANPSFTPAWAVADNPVLRQPPEPDDKIYVSSEKAALLLDFACATYGLLLRVFVQCFARPRAGRATDQKTLLATAFDLMHILGASASELSKLPANTDFPDTMAGMSFTMLRGVEPLLKGKVEATILREQLNALGSVKEILPKAIQAKMALLGETFVLHGEKT